MISSILDPASRFSKTVATGIRVSRNTHAPLRLSGTLSTAGHCDPSRGAMFLPPFILTFYHGVTTASRKDRHLRKLLPATLFEKGLQRNRRHRDPIPLTT